MTLDDLSETLSKALASGKIGQPVALRVHLQQPDPQSDLIAMLSTVMPLSRTAFRTEAATLTARRDSTERQLNVLLKYSHGETAFITLGRGAVERSNLHLLLIGNHGIIRLEGLESFELTEVQETAAKETAHALDWKTFIDRSLQSRGAVAVSET